MKWSSCKRCMASRMVVILLLAGISVLALGPLPSSVMAQETPAELLLRASRDGDLERVKALIQDGVKLEATDPFGLTPIQHAQVSGHLEIVQRLAAAGADKSRSWPLIKDLVDRLLLQVAPQPSPALALLIARDGQIIVTDACGFESMEMRVPATVETKFRIGSVTKQFTAAAILKLQEEGQLSVADTLDKYFPDYPRGKEITLHHLLTHTSGIPSYTDAAEFRTQVIGPVTSEALIDSFRTKPLEFEPGQKWKYCNSGYFLLGSIIEKVSHQTYDDYLRKTFFEPLGMTSTGVHHTGKVMEKEAIGYSWNSERQAYEKALNWDMSHAGGAGALYSTVGDLYRWNEGVFGGKVLSSESLKAAFTPAEVKEGGATNYGYGWSLTDQRGLKLISHGGGLDGFASGLMRLPDQRVTVVVLAAALPGAAGFDPGQIERQVATWLVWQEMKPAERPTTMALPEAMLDEYVGEYDYQSAVLRVRRDGSHLLAKLTGQPEYEIYPVSDSEFVWHVVEAKVKFVKDEHGRVVHAVHHQNGGTFEAPRMQERKEVELPSEKLDEYVGRYNYGLRIMVLKVTREEGRLMAQMTAQPKLEIVPKGDDQFFWRDVNAEVKFQRDESGKVIKAIHQQAGRTTEAPRLD